MTIGDAYTVSFSSFGLPGATSPVSSFSRYTLPLLSTTTIIPSAFTTPDRIDSGPVNVQTTDPSVPLIAFTSPPRSVA